jgi:phage-related holin
MGFDDELDVTDDIGATDVILASSSEVKQNPWIHNVAKYHKLPIFVVKVITRYIDFVLSTADCACINIHLFYIVNGRLIRWLK